MSTTADRLIESVDSVSVAEVGASAEGADVKSMPVSRNGPSSELREELRAVPRFPVDRRAAPDAVRRQAEGHPHTGCTGTFRQHGEVPQPSSRARRDVRDSPQAPTPPDSL